MIGDDQNSVKRVRASGVQASSPIDLLAIGFSRTEADAILGEGMARRILTRYGGIRGVGEASTADISVMTGLDEFEVLRAQALIEIGRKVGMSGKGELTTIQSPRDAVLLIVKELRKYRHEKREHFFAILLDTKNQILMIETVHIGTLNLSLVGPREVFRVAIREGASSVIVAHNHPSGDPTPSPEDIDVTRRLVEIGKLLDMPILDHVIVGEPNYVSLHDRGIL
jgi:DNA repair protein RadC